MIVRSTVDLTDETRREYRTVTVLTDDRRTEVRLQAQDQGKVLVEHGSCPFFPTSSHVPWDRKDDMVYY